MSGTTVNATTVPNTAALDRGEGLGQDVKAALAQAFEKWLESELSGGTQGAGGDGGGTQGAGGDGGGTQGAGGLQAPTAEGPAGAATAAGQGAGGASPSEGLGHEIEQQFVSDIMQKLFAGMENESGSQAQPAAA